TRLELFCVPKSGEEEEDSLHRTDYLTKMESGNRPLARNRQLFSWTPCWSRHLRFHILPRQAKCGYSCPGPGRGDPTETRRKPSPRLRPRHYCVGPRADRALRRRGTHVLFPGPAVFERSGTPHLSPRPRRQRLGVLSRRWAHGRASRVRAHSRGGSQTRTAGVSRHQSGPNVRSPSRTLPARHLSHLPREEQSGAPPLRRERRYAVRGGVPAALLPELRLDSSSGSRIAPLHREP